MSTPDLCTLTDLVQQWLLKMVLSVPLIQVGIMSVTGKEMGISSSKTDLTRKRWCPVHDTKRCSSSTKTKTIVHCLQME